MDRYKKKLKVIGVPWHTAHQYNLADMPFIEQYDLITNPYRSWAEVHRPFPDICKMVSHYEKGKYDFALLHLDQQSIYNPDKGDRISKGRIYSELNETIQDIPKIVINHQTPFHDKYDSEQVIEIIKDLVGDNTMVLNSYESAKQWGFGHTIIHGFKKDDWWDLQKEPRVVTVLSAGGMEKAYRRTFLYAVRRLLKEDGIPFVWIGTDVKFKNWDEYRDYLGRSLVFFFPAWQSPMPRARTEAMFSGCCIVTTPYQDADLFIEDGVNGYLTSRAKIRDPRVMDSPEYTAGIIKKLVLDEPDWAIKVGQAGKKTAHERFSHEKYVKQWEDLLIEKGILCLNQP